MLPRSQTTHCGSSNLRSTFFNSCLIFGQAKRAWFSALTANALNTALRSLREPDKNVSNAVEARTVRLGCFVIKTGVILA